MKKWSRVTTGRKNCNRCGAWRHAVFFHARVRNSDGTIKYLASICETCHNRQGRDDWAQASQAKKRRANARSRAWYRRDRRLSGVREIGPRVRTNKRGNSVDRLPFARWLRRRIIETSVAEVSRETGLSERRIYTIINGWDRNKGRIRQVDHVSIYLVDEALSAAGESGLLNRMYPMGDE